MFRVSMRTGLTRHAAAGHARRVRRLSLVVVLVLSAAPPAMAVDSLVKLRPPDRGFQVRLAPFDLAAHDERELCQAVRVPVTKPVDVDRIKVKLPYGDTFGSHHVAMFLADAPLF